MIPGGMLYDSWKNVDCFLKAGCVIPGGRSFDFGSQICNSWRPVV